MRRLVVTVLACSVLAALVLELPLKPWLGVMQWVRTPVAVLIVVCGLGKLLYDTLFFDRYA